MPVSFDTNVAVRLLVVDDVAQAERAGRAFRAAIAADGAFFTTTVLVETVWVLRVSLKQDRATIAGLIGKLINVQGVLLEHPDVIRRALAAYASGAADFSDYVIREASRDASALPVVTFDDTFARDADVQLVPGA